MGRKSNAEKFELIRDAAPDLFEALMELLCWLGPGTAESLGCKCDTLGEARDMADAAIAKALGEGEK